MQREKRSSLPRQLFMEIEIVCLLTPVIKTNPDSPPYWLMKYLKLAYDLYERVVVLIFSDLLTSCKAMVIFRDREQSRDVICVGDVASANVKVLKAQSNVYLNVPNGFSISVNELFAEMKKATNSLLSPIYQDERPGGYPPQHTV